jgi:glycosyltransferase involved in cell wall biosynthesis
VTIGIPVRNTEDTIGATLTTVIDQDYPCDSLEVLIVDDGCTDRTTDIVKDRLASTKLRWKIHKTNGKGLGTARQMILDNAKGKYIVWVDGDIVLFSDFVTVLTNFMEKNPCVGQAKAKWEPYLNGNLVGDLENMKYVGYELTHGRNRRFFSKLVGIGASISRRDALAMVGGFDAEIKGSGEDIDILAKMLKMGWNTEFVDARWQHKPAAT